MSRTRLATIIAAHSCRVRGVVYRFQLEFFATEPQWSRVRCLLGVRVNSDTHKEGTVLNVLVRGATLPAEVLSLLNDALAASITDRDEAASALPVRSAVDG
jgi:hypothetical protein